MLVVKFDSIGGVDASAEWARCGLFQRSVNCSKVKSRSEDNCSKKCVYLKTSSFRIYSLARDLIANDQFKNRDRIL